MEVEDVDLTVPPWQRPADGLPGPMERLELYPDNQPDEGEALILSGYLKPQRKNTGPRWAVMGVDKEFLLHEIRFFRMASPIGILPEA